MTMADTDTASDAAATDADLERRRTALASGMGVSYWAGERPDVAAIVSEHGERTYAELNARVNQLVHGLAARGVQPGDAVALISRNRPEFAEVYAATHRAGLRLTTVNWHLTADEAGYIVDNCEARVVIADARLATMARGAADQAPRAEILLAIGGDIEGFEPYESLLDGRPTDDPTEPILGSTMLYTSGTTGRPKGVHKLTSPAVAAATGWDYAAGDVHLCTGPLYHAAPLAFSLAIPISGGATVVLMDGWSPDETLRLVEEHRVTHTHLVPTMFHRLLALPDDVRATADVSSVRYIIHGAAPCPVPVKHGIIEWFGPVVNEYYAATEGVGSIVDSATWLEHPGTVGKVEPPDQVVVADENFVPLPPGEVGLLWLKSPPEKYRFSYFKDEGKTDKSYRGEYFTLGDVGYLDADGYLYLTDRSADLIISGGVNIYPAEVDAVLLTHPAVADAATIGVPDDEWGERVLSVVELRAGVEPTDALADELVAHCRERLAGFKCPRAIDFVDELPRQDSGKIYKRRLRDQYR
jgi:long-chain acyl-CoA synthetase